MTFKILTYNNRAGIVNDAMLLQDLIYNNVTKDADVQFIDTLSQNPNNPQMGISSTGGAVGVWIQNPRYDLLNNFKKNVWFINEEWCSNDDLKNINEFDYVVCKNKFAKDLLGRYRSDVICLPLLSYDYYDPSVARTDKFLHFNGKAIQKNTELVVKQKQNITVVDLTCRFNPAPANINYITTYMIRRQVKKMLNSHTVHLCPSMYESWGHYLFEGLSTGAEIVCSGIPSFTEILDPDLVHILPVVEKTDMSYWYDSDNISSHFPLRKSYYIEPQVFSDYLNNFVPKGRDQERRQMYLDIMDRNKKALVDFFSSI
jgi:hypothetical protein